MIESRCVVRECDVCAYSVCTSPGSFSCYACAGPSCTPCVARDCARMLQGPPQCDSSHSSVIWLAWYSSGLHGTHLGCRVLIWVAQCYDSSGLRRCPGLRKWHGLTRPGLRNWPKCSGSGARYNAYQIQGAAHVGHYAALLSPGCIQV